MRHCLRRIKRPKRGGSATGPRKRRPEFAEAQSRLLAKVTLKLRDRQAIINPADGHSWLQPAVATLERRRTS